MPVSVVTDHFPVHGSGLVFLLTFWDTFASTLKSTIVFLQQAAERTNEPVFAAVFASEGCLPSFILFKRSYEYFSFVKRRHKKRIR